jgi:hypothetical protein
MSAVSGSHIKVLPNLPAQLMVIIIMVLVMVIIVPVKTMTVIIMTAPKTSCNRPHCDGE